jgi:D-alanine-D-alanine ligase
MVKTVAVFFGGKSTEHDISIITALSSVIKPLELSKKYIVIPVYISKEGEWYSDEKLKNIQTFRSKGIDDLCARQKPLAVVFDGGMILRKAGLRNKDIRVDIAFPAMHGTYGEDGSLMGLFRMAGIPFVGSDMAASVIAMDKVLAKQIIQANDISTPNFTFFSKTEFEANPTAIVKNVISKLRFPQFVKPAHLGSSIGIAKVNSKDELQNAIEVAAYYDDKILVEESVENLIEVTLPIMGNAILQSASVERPLSGSDKFFDFDTKYISGGKKSGGSKKMGSQGYSEIPAKLPDGLYDASVDTAKKAYAAVGCEGISRVDLLIDSKSRTVYFNEINTLPGDLYAHNWRASGVSSVDLVCRLVELAEERFARNQKLETTFSSSFLKQF